MTSTAGANTETRKGAATMSVGEYIAQRLVELGVRHYFSVPLVQSFNAQDGNGFSVRVTNEAELEDAIAKAVKHDAPSLIECIIDRDDCTKQLLQLGSRIAATNSRPPKA